MTARRVVVFGRADDCDVQIDDEYASPHHAEAFQDSDGQVWIRDLGSTNGTWVQRDGAGPAVKVSLLTGPLRIQPGDTVRIGRTAIPWTRQ